MEALLMEVCPLCRCQARLWTRGRFALCSIQCADCGDYDASHDALKALARLPQSRVESFRKFVRDAKSVSDSRPRFQMLPGLTRLFARN